MAKFKRSFDPLLFLLAVLSVGFTWWLIKGQTEQIDTFQSPLPILNYEKTVNKQEVKVVARFIVAYVNPGDKLVNCGG